MTLDTTSVPQGKFSSCSQFLRKMEWNMIVKCTYCATPKEPLSLETEHGKPPLDQCHATNLLRERSTCVEDKTAKVFLNFSILEVRGGKSGERKKSGDGTEGGRHGLLINSGLASTQKACQQNPREEQQ